MAAVFNIAKGRVVQLYHQVKSGSAPNGALILIPLETAGLEADLVLLRKDDVVALLAGATNEQTTMGRKTLVAADLIAWAPNDAADYTELSLPTVAWTGASGNPISRIVVCVDLDTTGGTDADLIPLCMFDAVATPDGTTLQMTGGIFYRAA